jgi:hypothetical protein
LDHCAYKAAHQETEQAQNGPSWKKNSPSSNSLGASGAGVGDAGGGAVGGVGEAGTDGGGDSKSGLIGEIGELLPSSWGMFLFFAKTADLVLECAASLLVFARFRSGWTGGSGGVVAWDGAAELLE